MREGNEITKAWGLPFNIWPANSCQCDTAASSNPPDSKKKKFIVHIYKPDNLLCSSYRHHRWDN